MKRINEYQDESQPSKELSELKKTHLKSLNSRLTQKLKEIEIQTKTALKQYENKRTE